MQRHRQTNVDRPLRIVAITICLPFFISRPVGAQPTTAPSAEQTDEDDERPWFRGVSVADQNAAKALFEEGAVLHREALYQQAINKYEQALAHWQHPGIYFNMARALRDRLRLVDAYRALQQATRYGPKSLDADDFKLAQQLLRELDGQLAHLELSCDVERAEIQVDNKRVFLGPGTQKAVVLPGPHRIAAERDGYIKDEQWIQLGGGEHRTIELQPLSLKQVAFVDVSCSEDGAKVILDGQPFLDCPGNKSQMVAPNVAHTAIITHPERMPNQEIATPTLGQRLTLNLHTVTREQLTYERPIPRWIPLTVAGAGLAVGATGGVFRWRAGIEMTNFDEEFSALCENGCRDFGNDSLANMRSRAELQNTLGISALLIGGIGLVTAVGIMLWNQPRAYSEDRQERQSTIIRPFITAEEAGIVSEIRF